jgi:8-oxo-dGTP pyrophosphatase MutT (NUDIX family)
MKRQNLFSLLSSYVPDEGEENRMYNETLAFIGEHAECFDRTLSIGHVTGSGWVISPGRDKVLLMHHMKLDKWFQPGGHCDGDPDVAAVALKEVKEETGLRHVQLLTGAIFDIDVHEIPAKNELPAHYHYDIRFLFEADPTDQLFINGESRDLRWVRLAEVEVLNDSESILRMARKTTARFTTSKI